MSIVYLYDPETGVYLNRSVAAEGAPANSTPYVPPSPPDPKMQHSVFRDGEWQVEDMPVLKARYFAGEDLTDAEKATFLPAKETA